MTHLAEVGLIRTSDSIVGIRAGSVRRPHPFVTHPRTNVVQEAGVVGWDVRLVQELPHRVVRSCPLAPG